jgi:uncharacterized membrane protein YdbT with pleckstrin-like domain
MPEPAQPSTEHTTVIRPTGKPALFALALAGLIVAGSYWAYFRLTPEAPGWAPLLSFVTLIPALLAWLDTRRVMLRLDGNELRFVSGLFAKTSRTIDLRLVRAARPERSFLQRLWNVGTLIVETDTAEARLEIRDIDSPARRAKEILAAAETARQMHSTSPPQLL